MASWFSKTLTVHIEINYTMYVKPLTKGLLALGVAAPGAGRVRFGHLKAPGISLPVRNR